ncbi:MAG: replicative DNA helicase, partial [Candidatus Tectomicrobia bacterium]|nr:replicative DNA helicase [Candidatus Tectomicrobia bacterium]
LNIAHHIAVVCRTPVALFSLEMSKEQLIIRMLCSEARINSIKLKTGYLSKSELKRLPEAAGVLSEAPIFIDDTPLLSVLEIRSKARRLQAEHNLGLIIIDYLQLIDAKENRENRQQEISEVTRSLKALAKELGVPVVALSQLSRAVEQRPNRRPQLSDLRESGAIEQDGDLIAFIYRDELYKQDSPDKGIAEIIISKQRNGPTGVVKLKFFNEYTRFENLSDRA